MILIIILITIIYMIYVKCFKKKSETDMELELYGRKTCPYTVEMIKKLDKSNISYKYIEVTKEHNIPAVPHIVNKKNGKNITGSVSIPVMKKSLKD